MKAAPIEVEPGMNPSRTVKLPVMRSDVRYTPETEWTVSPVYEYIVLATAHGTHNTPRMMQSVSMRTMMVSLPWN
jgi:hypothetical protein